MSQKALEILGGNKAVTASSGDGFFDSERNRVLPNSIASSTPIFNITSGSISSLFARYAKEAKVEGLTFHCLRRTAATRLAKKLTVWELCSMFGWADPKIPMKHYYKSDAAEIAAKLDS